jgi:hypothetical protein
MDHRVKPGGDEGRSRVRFESVIGSQTAETFQASLPGLTRQSMLTLGSLSGHAAEVTEQAGHIDRARGQKNGHQHLVHRGLRGPPVESPAKHGRDSAQESQNLFFGGFISRLRNPARFSAKKVIPERRFAPGKASLALFVSNELSVGNRVVERPAGASVGPGSRSAAF